MAIPNFFGTAPDIDLVPIYPLLNDTAHEQLVWVGYQPDFGRLEAVVDIKQNSGYGGSRCSPGDTGSSRQRRQEEVDVLEK